MTVEVAEVNKFVETLLFPQACVVAETLSFMFFEELCPFGSGCVVLFHKKYICNSMINAA